MRNTCSPYWAYAPAAAVSRRFAGSDYNNRMKNGFVPRADISEDESNFYIELELPGVAKEDVKVSVQDNMLEIRGEKKLESRSENRNPRRNERFSGEFSRRFELSERIISEQIEAKHERGILMLTLPKNPDRGEKTVEIN